MTTVAFVVGEPSGDRIGADLIRSLKALSSEPIEAIGLGGEAMQAEGVETLFDIDELSIIGIGAIVARLPQLLRRVAQTADFVIRSEADILVIIDSPSFSHRVAKRVRAKRPDMPIVNYVPPTVWAYRSHRAASMRPYVDHAICVLPFEPETMARLGGPPATYVGHPLMTVPEVRAMMAAADNSGVEPRPRTPPTLLILPGSRRGEIDRLIGDFGRTFERLTELVPGVKAILPAVPRHRTLVEERVAAWAVRPRIVTGEAAKWRAFSDADAALAASGTVALELALAGVPMALAYKLDPVSYRFRHIVTAWTAAMPNFILGYPMVPEHFHETVRPEHLARRMVRLLNDTTERRAQIEGCDALRKRMTITRPPGEAAAEIVLATIAKARRGRISQLGD